MNGLDAKGNRFSERRKERMAEEISNGGKILTE